MLIKLPTCLLIHLKGKFQTWLHHEIAIEIVPLSNESQSQERTQQKNGFTNLHDPAAAKALLLLRRNLYTRDLPKEHANADQLNGVMPRQSMLDFSSSATKSSNSLAIPLIIDQYNHKMGQVDQADHLQSGNSGH